MDQFRWLFVFALLVLNGGLFGQATKKRTLSSFWTMLDGAFRPFGQTPYLTPNVEKLAADGYRFNRFYVPQGICSASRSALLTGCYPGRTKMFGAHAPRGRAWIPVCHLGAGFEVTRLRYGLVWKWHLGDHPETRPLARGFDENAGLMYSNDMWLHHPENPEFWGKYPLPYWDNGRVTIEEVDHDHQRC